MSKKYIVGVLVGFFACFFGNAFGRAMRECLHNHRKWNGSGAIYNVTGESHCEFSALSGLALFFLRSGEQRWKMTQSMKAIFLLTDGLYMTSLALWGGSCILSV